MSRLFVFVEGLDDERFFRWYFKEGNIEIICYANEKYTKIDSYIKSIKRIPDTEYIIIADADGKSSEDKKQIVLKDFPSSSIGNIYVVQYEIESWYLAGVTAEACTKHKVKHFRSTDNITKEIFDGLIPKRFSRVDYMIEILKKYSIDEARTRNKTFKIFNDIL